MRIIIGRSRSGKTNFMIEEIAIAARQRQGKQYLIVPELFSHAYERRLAAATNNQAARTAEVLSFTRLSSRVFAQTGGLAQVSLDAAGRLLTLHEAACRVQASMQVYTGLTDRPDLLREMLMVIDELKTCVQPPEALFHAAQQMRADGDELLAGKLIDLGALYTAYERLCEQTIPDPRSMFDRVADALPRSTIFDDAQIYIDSFASFTPQELRIIDGLLQKKLSLTVAITADLAQADIFVSGCKTVSLLKRMAARHGIHTEVIDLGEAAPRPHDLAVLEQVGLHIMADPQPADGNSVTLVCAATPFEECTHAAAWIRRMVRQTGAHWRDFAVVARDGDGYAAALEMAMSRYDIPIFLSQKTDLLQKPPMALVIGALEAATNGLRYEDVFGCLKTGLCAVTPDEVDLLENYVITWRIRGSRWNQTWINHPDGYGLPIDDTVRARLDTLNELRIRAITPFIRLQTALKKAQTVQDCVYALYTFVEEEDTANRMAACAQLHEEQGRLQLADEYRQLWEILMGAMEQMVWVCGDVPMTASRFAALFHLILSEYDVGVIPVSLDRVTCGPIDRVCQDAVKYLIVLGCNDGILPKAPGPSAVLTETDRLALDAVGMTLSSFGAERMMMEQEIIYKAIACPTERLVLSWHTADADGTASRPSYLIGTFRARLSGLDIERVDTGLDALQAPRPAAELACAALGDGRSPAACAALRACADDQPLVARARLWSPVRGPLHDRQTITALYGKRLNLTASRVDQFYSCPFAFFMQYGLGARARKRADFAAPEAGTLIHYVLETVLQQLAQQPGGAVSAAPRTIKKLLRAAVQTYIEQTLGGLEDKTARFRALFRRLVKSVETILDNILEELRASEFQPIDYELNFSFDGDLPPVTCNDGDISVTLSGKVDRVDGYIQNGRLYLRILDYKSGKKSFSLSDVWNGLNMQLIIYLYALQQKGLARYRARISRALNEIRPAGVLYVPVHDVIPDAARAEDDETLKILRARALRRSGLLSDELDILEAMEKGLEDGGRFLPVRLKVAKSTKKDPDPMPTLSALSSVANLERFGRLARYTHKKLLEMGHEIWAGKVEAQPTEQGGLIRCQWCTYRAACRFDQSAGDACRTLKKWKDSEVWDMLEEDEHESVDK